MRCIVIDDEPLARKGMELLIADVDWLEHQGSFDNPLMASDFLARTDIDLIFLDIEMPGLNGLDFLKNVQTKAQVILTTAYPQYALEAFELAVMDYLVKPIKFERFFKAVYRVRELSTLPKSEVELNTAEEHFFIKSDRKIIKLFFNEILYIKGLKDYVMIYTVKGKYITAMNVKTVFDQLSHDHFARVSKSYIINVDRMTSVDHDLIYLEDEEIPLGKTYKEAFISKFVKERMIKRK